MSFPIWAYCHFFCIYHLSNVIFVELGDGEFERKFKIRTMIVKMLIIFTCTWRKSSTYSVEFSCLWYVLWWLCMFKTCTYSFYPFIVFLFCLCLILLQFMKKMFAEEGILVFFCNCYNITNLWCGAFHSVMC